MIESFRQLSPMTALLYCVVANVSLFVIAMVVGEWLVRRFSNIPLTEKPDPVERTEILLAASCVLLNSIVAFAGWLLWTHDWVVLRTDIGWRVVADFFVLLIVMDFCMYVLHRVAHHPWIYPLAHQTHHRYDRPRPLSLFVLNPLEVLGFGGLWLTVLCCYSFSWVGMIAFLTLNLASGTLGHLGVEPFPTRWKSLPILKYLGSSTFHSDHHQHPEMNYGFYTTIWDRLFRTGRSSQK